MLVILVIIIARLVFLQLFPAAAQSLQNLADNQYTRQIELLPYRGIIYDHRKHPLAVSIKAPSIAVNPRVFNPSSHEISKLARTLDVPLAHIKKIAHRKTYFAWLKRKVDNRTYQDVLALDLKGIHYLNEPARFYPLGQSAAALLGYVGLDNKGLLGLEREYNSVLSGNSQKVVRFRDAKGQTIFLNSSAAAPEESGHNIVLTLDKVIQEITENALKKWVTQSAAKGGFAVVSDPHTGRIFAIANYPTFNPNDTKHLDIMTTSNHAISDLFEPGSIMKPLVISKALDLNVTSPDEIYNCEKSGAYRIDEHSVIRDDHPKEFRSTAEIVIHSSNIGTAKIAQKVGPERVYQTLAAFGIGKQEILGLPGESKGRVDDWNRWRPIRFANIAFGQGMVVTGLEVVQAFSVFANGGNLVRPYIVESVETAAGDVVQRSSTQIKEEVISPKTAQIMREMLARVVTEGTGALAATKEFTTGGKTGTAQKFDVTLGKYSPNKRTASFVGFSPVKDPHLVIFVAIDEPSQKPYYGGTWAAPAFSEIVEKSLKYLNVAPDKLTISLNTETHSLPSD